MKTLLERARAVMPGGVSSPVRAFGAVPGDPPIVARGRGAEITDVDGRTYVDLVQSWGPLILGHAHPAVIEAVERAARDGLSFGATCSQEIELAEAVLARYPFAERVRFVSSGTEAVMSAVRLARGVTGRERIVKFEGCYHGHSDGLLVKAGSGLATLGTPSSAGVPAAFAALTEVLPLDDEEALHALFAAKGSEIAAVVIEPLPANAGLLLQRREFLLALREVTRAHGALLILDEVISGLRVAPGGATELLDLEPDLVTLGKIVGGGMPVGAYAGPARSMRHVAPEGPVYQAGTLSGNPVAMAAGLATLRELERAGTYERLEATGEALQAGWEKTLARNGVQASVVRVGSILWLALQPGPAPRTFAAIDPGAAGRYGELHRHLLAEGLWMAPSAYEVAFVSTAHEPGHIARAVAALDVALASSGVQVGVKRGRRTLHVYWAVVLVIAVLFGWWMVYFYNQGEILTARMSREGVVLTPAESAALQHAMASTTRMLLFEGAFLGLLLLGSMGLVVRALQREVQLARQQHNFLSAVTHELKSPIASARLYLESIELGRVDEQKRERYVRHAREDLDRLRAMVEQLLQSARLSTTAPELFPITLDLGDHVGRVLADLESERVTSGASVELDCPQAVLVRVDPEALTTIVRNLVSNAVKYGGEPARIEIEVSNGDGRARLLVRDHGPGLGDLDGQRIFEPFVRGGDENVRTRQGVGLGLFLVGELVKASGGAVAARPASPGLAVEVLLPVGAAEGVV